MQKPPTPHSLCWACKGPTDSRKRLESGVVQIWKERGPDPTVQTCRATAPEGARQPRARPRNGHRLL